MTRRTAVIFHNSYRPSNSRSPVKTAMIICEGHSEKIPQDDKDAVCDCMTTIPSTAVHLPVIKLKSRS